MEPNLCTSTYTVNRYTGELLRCERHLRGHWDQVVHSNYHIGIVWTWSDKAADQPAK